jgi:cytochrome c oxidase assembly protein subunit 11
VNKPSPKPPNWRQKALPFVLTGVVAGMLGMSYAAVPLYRIFCQVTGYGGTTQVAKEAPREVLDRNVTVRFNADVAPGLAWSFEPVQRDMTLKVGETGIAYYRARNLTDKPIVGMATFNVTPDKAGQYFDKIACFCFDQQRLEPGQSVDMPVTFFVDPSMAKDRGMDDVYYITLSYTFFPVAAEDIKKRTAEVRDDSAAKSVN